MSVVELPSVVIVMGVCGCGKTSVGRGLAERIGGIFEDADDFHSAANKTKMSAKIPLTDEDRWPWLETLRGRIEHHRAVGRRYVLACSALKAVYRDRLRNGDAGTQTVFVWLDGSRELIESRMSARAGHYMPVGLLDSQFAILEPTPDLKRVSIDATPEEIVEAALEQLRTP